MTTAEKIAVMQAYEDGKTIGYGSHEMVKGDGHRSLWNWVHGDYFVKPEPKTEMELFEGKWAGKKIRRPRWELDKWVIFSHGLFMSPTFRGNTSQCTIGEYGINGEWELHKEPSYGPMSLETFPKGAVWITHDDWDDGTSQLVNRKSKNGVVSHSCSANWPKLMDYKNAETGEHFRVEL